MIYIIHVICTHRIVYNIYIISLFWYATIYYVPSLLVAIWSIVCTTIIDPVINIP